MSFSLSVPPLRTVHCYSIFITIWCVGDEFSSLSASQVSADSCMCCNWQLHREATLVTVQHHSLSVIAVTMCCVDRSAVPFEGRATVHQIPASALVDHHPRKKGQTVKLVWTGKINANSTNCLKCCFTVLLYNGGHNGKSAMGPVSAVLFCFF